MLKAATAEGADEAAIRMVRNEDDTDDSDSDYNSVDAERDAQEEEEEDEDEDEDDATTTTESRSPKLKYPFLRAVSFFRGYIDKKWAELQERFHRDLGHDKHRKAMGNQTFQVPMAGIPRGLDPTIQ
jgi:hypothetical protein